MVLPLADLRSFHGGAPPRVARPAWPVPDARGEFVRGFGPIRVRRRGGAPGWAGEHVICEVRRGVSLHGMPRTTALSTGEVVSSFLAFKRLFFDGMAVGKFEIGFAAARADHAPMDARSIAAFVDDALSREVIVRSEREASVYALRDLGAPLARSYEAATAPHRDAPPSERRFVLDGAPCVLVEHQAPGAALALSHAFQGEGLSCWSLEIGATADRALARDLRVCIMRLHAEREVLTAVVARLASGELRPARRGPESQALQRYLLRASQALRRLGKRGAELTSRDAFSVAARADEDARKGGREALVSALEDAMSELDLRPNVARELLRHAEEGSIEVKIGEVIMGNKVSSGNNSNVNVGSSLSGVQQQAVGAGEKVSQAHAAGDGEGSGKLESMVASLRAELAALSAAHKDEVELLTARLDEVMKQAQRPAPEQKKSLLDVSAQGLLDAAKAVAGVLPSAAATATTVAKLLLGG